MEFSGSTFHKLFYMLKHIFMCVLFLISGRAEVVVKNIIKKKGKVEKGKEKETERGVVGVNKGKT